MASDRYEFLVTARDLTGRTLQAVNNKMKSLTGTVNVMGAAMVGGMLFRGFMKMVQLSRQLAATMDQNSLIAKNYERVQGEIGATIGMAIMPMVEKAIQLWDLWGTKIQVFATAFGQSFNMISGVVGEFARLSGLAMGQMIKGNFDNAMFILKEMPGIIKNTWERNMRVAVANTQIASDEINKQGRKRVTDAKGNAKEEADILYNSYAEFKEIQDLKRESIDKYNEDLEERRKTAYDKQKAEEDAQVEREDRARENFYKKHSDMINMLTNLASSFRVGFGNAFQGAITGGIAFSVSMIQLFRNMRDMVIRFIGEMIAKMVTLFLLKKLLGFATGGGLTGLAGILKGTIKGITGAQTSPGQLKIIPGSRFEPVPILAHGGEAIGRPGAGGMGGMIINVQGSIYNGQETAEAIRSGLYNLRRGSGRTV